MPMPSSIASAPTRCPRKDGGIILGHLLNENGFIESEITITRLAADHFYVLSAAAAQLL